MTVDAPKSDKLGLILRVGLFVILGWIGMILFPWVMYPLAGLLVTSALSVFAAAAVANAVVVRIYERGRLSDLGLGWTVGSAYDFLVGTGSAIAAAITVVGIPLLFRIAKFEPAPGVEHPWSSFLFVSVVLLFGAMGEEMLFHGYGFQVLLRAVGPFATILPTSILFGVAHMGNANANFLGVFNTVAWGILLGWACWRSGALWLPIGLHFGWNFTLPLFGVNLSGFTMGVTGYTLHWTVGNFWSGGNYGPEGSILTTAVVVGLFFWLPRVTLDRSS